MGKRLEQVPHKKDLQMGNKPKKRRSRRKCKEELPPPTLLSTPPQRRDRLPPEAHRRRAGKHLREPGPHLSHSPTSMLQMQHRPAPRDTQATRHAGFAAASTQMATSKELKSTLIQQNDNNENKGWTTTHNHPDGPQQPQR